MADKRYIDADKLTFSRVRIIHSDGTIGGWHAVVMSSVIKDAPAADVVEVRHGEWEQQLRPYDDEIMCSVCGANFNIIDNCTEKFDYCPNCGAKMDGEREDIP